MDDMRAEPAPATERTESAGTCWYSRRSATLSLMFLFLIVNAISHLIPPFQSPDEGAHLERAYLLAKGEIFLRTIDGVTGGAIDTGFLHYMNTFLDLRFEYKRKITHSVIRSTNRLLWSGKREFTDVYNTALYFPFPYMPQALAFTIGERLGLSINDSYHLARLFSLTATLGMFLTALLIYPAPLPACLLMTTPMALFQLGSASLDAVTFGATAMAAALFMRGANTRYSFDTWMHITLIACLFTLATSRIFFIPLTLLPTILYKIRRSRTYLVSTVALIILSIGWISFALHSVKGLPNLGLSTTELAIYYAARPGAFLQVLFNTITNGQTLRAYWIMFVGLLGWLDTPLDSAAYGAFAVSLAVFSFVCFDHRRTTLLGLGHLALVASNVLSVLLMFFIELVTWTPHPAMTIGGIQGRYFIPVLLILSYSTFCRCPRIPELRVCSAILFLMASFSVAELAEKRVRSAGARDGIVSEG
jgi:uncharacterized membrane protein